MISSVADGGRAVGSLAIPRAITSSAAGGNSGRRSVGRGGGAITWECKVAASLGRGYGTSPVRHSYSTPASAYMSLAALAGSPWICSGAT